MEKGAVLDFAYAAVYRQRWIGRFTFSFWGGLKTDWDESRLVDTYRCQSCGYLKSYATVIGGKPSLTKS